VVGNSTQLFLAHNNKEELSGIRELWGLRSIRLEQLLTLLEAFFSFPLMWCTLCEPLRRPGDAHAEGPRLDSSEACTLQ